MAVVIDSHRSIITAAPGTGSTALLEAVGSITGSRPVPGPCDEVPHEFNVKHATVADLQRGEFLPVDHGLLVVTTIRNPFDYWPSEWLRTRTRWVEDLRRPASWVYTQPDMVDRIVDAVTMEFIPWLHHVLDGDAASGVRRHLNPGHVSEADVVFRMETLTEDAMRWFGPDFPPVPRRNVTPDRQPYWTYYDTDARDLVAAVNEPTLTDFGYRF